MQLTVWYALGHIGVDEPCGYKHAVIIGWVILIQVDHSRLIVLHVCIGLANQFNQLIIVFLDSPLPHSFKGVIPRHLLVLVK